MLILILATTPKHGNFGKNLLPGCIPGRDECTLPKLCAGFHLLRAGTLRELVTSRSLRMAERSEKTCDRHCCLPNTLPMFFARLLPGSAFLLFSSRSATCSRRNGNAGQRNVFIISRTVRAQRSSNGLKECHHSRTTQLISNNLK